MNKHLRKIITFSTVLMGLLGGAGLTAFGSKVPAEVKEALRAELHVPAGLSEKDGFYTNNNFKYSPKVNQALKQNLFGWSEKTDAPDDEARTSFDYAVTSDDLKNPTDPKTGKSIKGLQLLDPYFKADAMADYNGGYGQGYPEGAPMHLGAFSFPDAGRPYFDETDIPGNQKYSYHYYHPDDPSYIPKYNKSNKYKTLSPYDLLMWNASMRTPQHRDPLNWGKNELSYDKHLDWGIGRWHGWLAYEDLQKEPGTHSVLRADLLPNAQGARVGVKYPNAARVAEKDPNTGKWGLHKVSVLVVCSNIRYYYPWDGPRSIVFSRNLGRGIYYNGISQMNVDYIPYVTKDGQDVPLSTTDPALKNSHIIVHTINGLSAYGQHRVVGQDEYSNNEDYVRWDNYNGDTLTQNQGRAQRGLPLKSLQPYPQYGFLNGKKYLINKWGGLNETGESVMPGYGTSSTPGEFPLKKNNHLAKFWSGSYLRHDGKNNPFHPTQPIFHDYTDSTTQGGQAHEVSTMGVGGAYNTPDNYHGDRSVVITMRGNFLPLNVGTGVGYGSFMPQADVYLPKSLTKQGLIDVTYIDSSTGQPVKHYDYKSGQPGEKFFYKKYENPLPIPVSSVGYKLDNNFRNHWNTHAYNYPSVFSTTPQHAIIYVHKHNSKSVIPPLYKSRTHHILKHPNEKYTYRITGTVPNRKTIPGANASNSGKDWKTMNYKTPEYRQETSTIHADRNETIWKPINIDPFTDNGKTYYRYSYWNKYVVNKGNNYQWSHPVFTGYKYSDRNPNDYYRVTDNIPKDDSIVKLYAHDLTTGANLPVTHDGNRIRMNLDVNQFVAHRNDRFQIVVKVRANHLPNIQRREWHYILNHANDRAKDYDLMHDNVIKDHSKTVLNKIKREHFNIYYYDYNWDKNNNFMPKEIKKHSGYNNQYHAQFDSNHSVLRHKQGYAWFGSYIKVPIPHNMTDGHNHLYRFTYGEKTKDEHVFIGNPTPKNDRYSNANPNGYYGDSNTYKDGTFNMNYYKPFLIPVAHINKFGRFIVDTNKQGLNLPFKLDMNANSTLYNDWQDYDNGLLTITIYDAHNHFQLYKTSNYLHQILKYGPHATLMNEVKGNLNTKDDPYNYKRGQKVPLIVHFSFNNPGRIKFPIDGLTADHNLISCGYISTQDKITGKSFNHVHEESNDDEDTLDSDSATATLTEPERTIKYFGNTPVRVQHEQFSLHQRHDKPGMFKSGYGIRSDLVMMYRGWINSKQYGQKGTTSNYAFPDSWNQKSPQSPDSTENNISYMSNNRRDKFNNGANDMDRLEKDRPQFRSGIQYLPTKLDDVNGWTTSDQKFSNKVDYMYDHNFNQPYVRHGDKANVPGEYITAYQFYPRKLVSGSGDAELNTNKDPLASSSNSGAHHVLGENTSSSHVNGASNLGHRDMHVMFTPIDLEMDKYNTVFDKAFTGNAHRLGGNYFDFEDNRPDEVYGHMFEADTYPNDKNAHYANKWFELNNGKKGDREENNELSLQPVLSRFHMKIMHFKKYSQHHGDIVKNWQWKFLN